MDEIKRKLGAKLVLRPVVVLSLASVERYIKIYRGLKSMAVLQLQGSVFICKDQ